MPLTSRTFRIFVSSTFSDLKAERNALGEVARCLGSSMHPHPLSGGLAYLHYWRMTHCKQG